MTSSHHKNIAHKIRFRLLLVDEKTYVSRLEKESYRNKGIMVYQAESTSEAESILKNKTIEVICCNLDFAKQKGIQVYRKLRNSHSSKEYLWITTSLSYNLRKTHPKLYGTIDLFFVMPISKEYFIEKVVTALSQSSRQSTRYPIYQGYVRIKVGENYVQSNLIDLSKSGMQIQNTSEIQPGEQHTMILFFQDTPPLHITGKIVRKHTANPISIKNNETPIETLGISFVSLEEQQQKSIQSILERQSQLIMPASLSS